jgi:hypothetical protein
VSRPNRLLNADVPRAGCGPAAGRRLANSLGRMCTGSLD